MKRSFVSMALVVALLSGVGCQTLERTAYVGTASATSAVELARRSYIEYVNACQCVNEADFAKVEKVYQQYQVAVSVLETAVTAYKTAPSKLTENMLVAASQEAAASGSAFVSGVMDVLPATEAGGLKTKVESLQ